jgi:hypothetical protein
MVQRRKFKGAFWGALVGRVGGELAKRGGLRVVATEGAKKIARDQAEVQARKGVFKGVQAIQDRNIARITQHIKPVRDSYTTRMNRARDNRDMKEYFRLAREADRVRDAGGNPWQGAKRGGKVKKYSNALNWY